MGLTFWSGLDMKKEEVAVWWDLESEFRNSHCGCFNACYCLDPFQDR